jgi:hypothetical protein
MKGAFGNECALRMYLQRLPSETTILRVEAPIGYAMHYSWSADAVIRVYDAAGKVIETRRHKGRFSKSGEMAKPHHVFNPLQPGFAFSPNSAFLLPASV